MRGNNVIATNSSLMAFHRHWKPSITVSSISSLDCTMASFSRILRGGGSSLLKPLVARPFGTSSAALQQCYYTHEEEYETTWPLHPKAESAEGWIPGRGVQWVVIGDSGPNVRRQVYAEKLCNLLEVPLISMGSLLRQELNPCSPLYKQISNAVNEGKLVPEEVIFGLLSKRLDEGRESGESGFILDGIPRSRNQAEILDKLVDIDLVINFKQRKEHFINMGCFNMPNSSSFVSGSSTWKRNLSLRREPGYDLEDYYRQQRKLVDFQVAGGAPGDNWQGLLAALHLKQVSAAKSAQKLAA